MRPIVAAAISVGLF